MAKWLNFKHTRQEFHYDCESNGAIGLEGKQGIICSCFTEFMGVTFPVLQFFLSSPPVFGTWMFINFMLRAVDL
jgi:hypothetical protein